jgi:tetratricopeptide (TPR) repeat protein
MEAAWGGADRAGGVLAVTASRQARAQGNDDRDALNKQVAVLYGQGKYAEATEIAKRSLALAEKALGSDHPEVGKALNNLAELYQAQDRYTESRAALQTQPRALRERSGPRPPNRRHGP